MTLELTVLALAVLLGFFQVVAASTVATQERGVAWNMGPRDGVPAPVGDLAGRLDRAAKNFLETFPFFAAAVLSAAVVGRHDWLTVWGAGVYLAARIIYVPLYAFGVSGLRTLAFIAGMAGTLMVLSALFLMRQ